MTNSPVFETYDYIIGGKMVVGRAEMNEDFRMLLEDGDEDAKRAIKSKLIHDMAEFMLENQLVEFRQQVLNERLTIVERKVAVLRVSESKAGVKL